jgi:4-amino-4-deoxy-L-arabinose transferase-like glycosyltransferase
MRFVRSSWLLASLLLAITFFPSLHGDFVWDDATLIERNPAMHDVRGYRAILLQDTWGQATGSRGQAYHPVPMLSIWLQTLLFGVHLAPLRLVNVIVHACAVWVFVRLLARLGFSPVLARGAGLIVLLHPSVCEPVMWITGRHDSLATLFVLLALLVWPQPDTVRWRWWRAVTSGFGLGLAFLSKELSIFGPLLLLAWAATEHTRARLIPRARALGELAVAALPLLAAIGWRLKLGISLGSSQLQATSSEHTRSYATIVEHYAVQLLGWQNGPTIMAYQPLSDSAVAAVYAVLGGIGLGLGLLALRGGSTYAAALLGFVWFLLAMAPHVLSLPLLGLYGNRYAYPALFGLGLMLCALGSQLPQYVSVAFHRMWPAVALALALACVLRTGVEASRWSDNLTLFGADVQRDPRDGYALYHYATAVLGRDGCAPALPLFIRAAELAPRYERPFHNTVGCMINLGNAADALHFAERAVQLQPHGAPARYNLALVLAARGERKPALDHLRVALRLNPSYDAARAALQALLAVPEPQPSAIH